MSDTVTDLAGKTGISPDQAQKGLGAVLEFLQNRAPAAAPGRTPPKGLE